jgi:uncharacterized membrane protein
MPPKKATHLARVIERNIKTMVELRRQMEQSSSLASTLADRVTSFAGSVTFVGFHIVWFSGWMLWNSGWFNVPPFDPYPFGLLTMMVSLEAIFLSTFVLISQNRLAQIADDRSDLDLQIDLVAEYEVTKLLQLTEAIAKKIGVKEGLDPELDELKQQVTPESVLKEMARKRMKEL